jgi:hypothetical protein
MDAKSLFIESLILGVPIPQILLADGIGSSRYLVIDGKQRLLTIIEFFSGYTSDGRPFRLQNLRHLGNQLNGRGWEDIQRQPLGQKLDSRTIRTAVIRGWKSEEVLYEIFYRLNSGSVKLSPMELRLALYRGDFLRYVVEWTERPSDLHDLLRLRYPDKRMSDVEIAVRFLAFRSGIVTYSGNLKRFLDDFCKLANRKFNELPVPEMLDEMNLAIQAGEEVFTRKSFCRRWLPEDQKYDTRFNRALFDVLVYSLSHADARAWMLANSSASVAAYKKIFEDPKFRSSVETTTKSIDATRIRFSRWLGALAEVSHIQIPMPKISDEPSN